jgi:Flp pilus assembly pilin Flp
VRFAIFLGELCGQKLFGFLSHWKDDLTCDGLWSTLLTAERQALPMKHAIVRLWSDQSGQDIAEYAVMLAVILVIVVSAVSLIGSNANNVFSNVASSLQ